MYLNTVLYSPDDEGGGGEDLVAEAEAAQAEPEPEGPLSLADDAQVAWDGLDSPLTGREIREGYLRQSDYTRKTQELANQQKQWEKDREEAQRWQQYARQLEAQVQGRQQQPQQQQSDWLKDHEAWQQMQQQGGVATDQQLRALFGHLSEREIGAIKKQMQEQQGQFQYVLQDYVQTKQQFQELLSKQSEDAQRRAITSAVEAAGVNGDGATREFAEEMARDMFHSYEPDRSKGETMETYMQAFPDMFKDRWNRWKQVTRNMDKQELAAAKRQALPRQGGGATPSKPMKPETDEITDEILDKFEPEGGWTD